MNNYNLTTAVKDYALVGELVVKLTKNKPLSYWNVATGDQLLVEHGLQQNAFRRKLASGFIKMLDPKMVRRFSVNFGQKQLMENLVKNVVIGELSGFRKELWGVFLLQWISEPQTGVGFDYLRQTGTSTYADGNVRLLFDATSKSGDTFKLYSDMKNGTDGVVVNGTLAKLRLAYCSIHYEASSDLIPTTDYDVSSDLTPTIVYLDVDAVVANGSQGFSIPFPSGVPVGAVDTYTYVLARIDFFVLDAKGVKKSKEKGKFDTLQVVGCRL